MQPTAVRANALCTVGAPLAASTQHISSACLPLKLYLLSQNNAIECLLLLGGSCLSFLLDDTTTIRERRKQYREQQTRSAEPHARTYRYRPWRRSWGISVESCCCGTLPASQLGRKQWFKLAPARQCSSWRLSSFSSQQWTGRSVYGSHGICDHRTRCNDSQQRRRRSKSGDSSAREQDICTRNGCRETV